jgi:hypothetical protein
MWREYGWDAGSVNVEVEVIVGESVERKIEGR